jgi:DNA-binding CsgD family transcriptional regulator
LNIRNRLAITGESVPEQDELVAPRTVVPDLKPWGVTPMADLVFRMLTEFGANPDTQVGRSLGLPTPAVRAALDELSALDAVHCCDNAPGCGTAGRTWRAAAPATVLAVLRRRSNDRVRAQYHLRRHLQRLGSPADLVDQRELLHPDAVRTLSGGARVRERLTELVHGGRTEHLSMHPEPAFDLATVRAAAPLNHALLARGMAVLSLGIPAGIGDCTEPHARELEAAGMRYRELPELPIKLMIFDRSTAVIPIEPSAPGRGGLEIRAPSAVARLVDLFLHRFGQARPPRRGWQLPMTLTPRERAIITLLTTGQTDSDVSAQLGISVRTIAYTLRDLMSRLGVQNRFQLGLVLGAQSAAAQAEKSDYITEEQA